MNFDDIFVPNSDKTIGHLGPVAGSYDELQIGAIIDRLIPRRGPHTLTHGDIVKVMIHNGLGYVKRRLYLFPAISKRWSMGPRSGLFSVWLRTNTASLS